MIFSTRSSPRHIPAVLYTTIHAEKGAEGQTLPRPPATVRPHRGVAQAATPPVLKNWEVQGSGSVCLVGPSSEHRLRKCCTPTHPSFD